ncbi:MAG TPA: tetratricopeptide repeat protein [Pyrinomonadaceae bacterium]|nr:tetratricopeptide repeat protein [Pyrinomonadaceae bacterium]
MAIVEHSAGRNEKALRTLTNHAPLFEKIHNHTLKGSYHVTLGNRLENLWESGSHPDYLDRALIEYAAASYHFERAQHRCYLANTENNLGFLYFKIHRFEDAHKHLDRARRVLVSLKDVSGAAQVDETRACVYLQQGRVSEAERVMRSAVRNLEKSESHELLAEALITHGRALARLRNYGASLISFRRSITLCEHTGSLSQAADAALAAFQEIGERLTVSESGPLSSGRGMSEEKRAFEHEAIKHALENAKGSITNAARNLGISYQALAYMLETRHRDLLKVRTPARRRPLKRSKGS